MADSLSIACPFAEGDRVDHRIFGQGTVLLVAGGSIQPVERRSPPPTWKIEVAFDEGVGTKPVVHTFLTKVADATTRPFVFWDRQWRPLRDSWLAARRRHEAALTTFRPPPDPAELERLRAEEAEARALMDAFIEDETTGKHV